MRVKIKDIAYYLPEYILTNQELQADNPSWDLKHLEKMTGVYSRHIAKNEETALDLSIKACEKLFNLYPELPHQVDGIIFCTQSRDYVLPSTACVLHKHFEFSENVFALDIDMSCSGYIYGLAMCQGMIQSQMLNNLLLINADTYSKYINKHDRTTRVLFGDGAAVSWITSTDFNEGIKDILWGTSGKGYETAIIPAGGCRLPKSAETSILIKDESGNVRSLEQLHMNGVGVLGFINSKATKQIRKILEKNELTLNNIDRFVFHQASKMALDSLQRKLRIPSEKVYRNIDKVGNTVSACIPIALKEAIEIGKIKHKHTVLLSAFGAGLSWGTALVEI